MTETTSRMLRDRRVRTLRDLADRTGQSTTVEEVFGRVAASMP